MSKQFKRDELMKFLANSNEKVKFEKTKEFRKTRDAYRKFNGIEEEVEEDLFSKKRRDIEAKEQGEREKFLARANRVKQEEEKALIEKRQREKRLEIMQKQKEINLIKQKLEQKQNSSGSSNTKLLQLTPKKTQARQEAEKQKKKEGKQGFPSGALNQPKSRPSRPSMEPMEEKIDKKSTPSKPARKDKSTGSWKGEEIELIDLDLLESQKSEKIKKNTKMETRKKAPSIFDAVGPNPILVDVDDASNDYSDRNTEDLIQNAYQKRLNLAGMQKETRPLNLLPGKKRTRTSLEEKYHKAPRAKKAKHSEEEEEEEEAGRQKRAGEDYAAMNNSGDRWAAKLEEKEEREDHGEVFENRISGEIYDEYVVTTNEIRESHPKHPGNIVESKSLHSVILQKIEYTANLPNDDKTCLSDLQAETVHAAGERHEIILPNKQRAGFYIGDGTGVGKGRQVGAIIYDNFSRGRKKAIWFSASHSLLKDAERDLADIRFDTELIKIPTGSQNKAIANREGVLFCTYSMLIRRFSSILTWLVKPVPADTENHSSSSPSASASEKSKKTAAQLREEFEGVIVFDEGHCAKNLVPKKKDGASRSLPPSQTAKRVFEIQEKLPNARIVYVSATGAIEPLHMAYMTRLGLWGPSSYFKSFFDFERRIVRSGISSMELVAMEMKSLGFYCSRHLSFKGTTMDVHKHALTSEQQDSYNDLAVFWLMFTKWVYSMQDKDKKVFWGYQQRLFLQLILSYKVDACAKLTEEALAAGKSVVIGLFSTGEAKLAEVISDYPESEDFPEIISTSEAILHSALEYFDAPANLREAARELSFPPSPLDALIDQLGGPSRVAEMSGRSKRLLRNDENRFTLYSRKSKADNLQECQAFMNDEKQIAVITAAASVGISLQAAYNCANQRQRLHIILELPWSADKAIQQLGRTHRSNQSSCPSYKLLITDIGGEWRLATTIANRLATMGALNSGDRKASIASGSLGVFELSQDHYQEAHKLTMNFFHKRQNEHSLLLQQLDILNLQNVDKIPKFLNRILCLPLSKQQLFFGVFLNAYNRVVQKKRLHGQIDQGVYDIAAKLISLPTVVHEKKNHQNPNRPVNQSLKLKISVDRGISWEQALELYNNFLKDDASHSITVGFYKDKQKGIIVLADDSVMQGSIHICSPKTGHQRTELNVSEFTSKYEIIKEIGEAEVFWRQAYNDSFGIGIDKRIAHKEFYTGSILTLFQYLESRFAGGIAGHLQVVRVYLDMSELPVDSLANYPAFRNITDFSVPQRLVGVLV